MMALSDLISGFTAFSTPLYLVAASVVYYVVSSVVAWRRLSSFPGPSLARFSYLWNISNSRTGRPAETFTALNREHGPLVCIGPNDLVTDDPEILRRMNGARSTYNRSSWYNAAKFNPHTEAMFSMRNVKEHDKMKAQVAFAYSGKENDSLEASIDTQLANFMDLIRRKYLTKGDDVKPIDFGGAVQYFTLDVITEIAYGKAFGYLATDSDVHDYIKTAEDVVEWLQIFGETPFFVDILWSKWILGAVGPKPTDKSGMGKMMGVARDVVAKRFEPDSKDQRDMLGSFLRHGLSQAQAEQEVLFQITAGSDTTATAIRTTLLYLMTLPRAYHALKNEINTAIKEGRVSSPITVEEAKQLPYLQAIIYEGLRMNSPFTGQCSKEVPAGGDTINGKFIPGGTRIAQNFWGTLRRLDVFGKDADLFRPERWLEADEATRDNMVRTTELTFGYGRWGCSGKNVAFMELNKVYVELLRRFDLQIVYPGRAWNSVNHNLFIQKEFWVRVTEVEGFEE
ncbi:cytochrome p450 [Colletotrichum karsti]|uniref:Cytochrome P450 monooxygenase ABA1 n=1 Tax=Colletotrichum karsti TaxID=1095194 RepID=A0A9P6I1P0_9PEZI|nr:cytochrome p450 [Colletotrichum karsti]KAF9875337.1 cytochrome p450 [Colletotrichum karsti]